MKRSALVRRTPLRSKLTGSQRCARTEPMKRKAKRPWRPDAMGLAFNAWVRLTVLERDGRCMCCGLDPTPASFYLFERAHLFPLRMGRSRYNPKRWENFPAASVLLCRPCHQEHDEQHAYTWGHLGIDLAAREAEAREQCAHGWTAAAVPQEVAC